MNVALHGLEEAAGVRYRNRPDVMPVRRQAGSPVVVRYADDMVACCHSRQQAEQVKAQLARWLAPRGLVFNEDKTKIVHLEEGFDFLGFNVRRYRHGDGRQVVDQAEHGGGQAYPQTARRRDARLRGSNAGRSSPGSTRLSGAGPPTTEGVVSSKIFGSLDHYMWKLTYRWARRSHPRKAEEVDRPPLLRPVQQVQERSVGVRRPRPHAGDRRDNIAYLVKFAWTPIVRHHAGHGPGVSRRSGPDRLLGRHGDARSNPRWTATTCACSPSRTAAARCAATTCSPPISPRSPLRSGNDGG